MMQYKKNYLIIWDIGWYDWRVYKVTRVDDEYIYMKLVFRHFGNKGFKWLYDVEDSESLKITKEADLLQHCQPVDERLIINKIFDYHYKLYYPALR